MAYCPKCGVEVQKGNQPCPLCNFHIPKIDDSEQDGDHRFPLAVDSYSFIKVSVFKPVFIFVSVFVFIAVSMMFYIDFQVHGAFTWSRYSNISVLAGWGILFCSLSYMTSYFKKIIGILMIILGLLFGIDYFYNGHWFVPLALPIVGGMMVIVICYLVLIKLFKFKKINIIKFLFIALIILCLWTNYFICSYTEQSDWLSWSIVAAAQLVPISIVILYIFGLPEYIKEKMIRKFHL
ncbi:DUF6320 domain-containing protein [Scopulibacillus cellulosilyticus]|uniref:DUF6320 domain-containing protein n=1 Tax=Scopulibacillus cellulosilyticus TaxID=2665665 RepID=A0ABW2PZU4_9BACL